MKTPTYDKPFKTYDELIRIMENRNIVINDKEFAFHALENFSYYGIVNGYKDTFLQVPGSDDFIPGTKFEDLYTLHIVDTSLNNIIFKYILFLEKALKSRLSYLISEKYGVYTDLHKLTFDNKSDYLYFKNYSNSSGKRINILKKLKECAINTSKNPMLEHYKLRKNHVPAWIFTTSIPYGLAIQWYDILKSDDKLEICNTFIASELLGAEKVKEFVKKTFEITKEYRNKIAHGSRTFSISHLPRLPKEQLLLLTSNAVSEKEYNNKMGQNDTMAVLLSLIVMLNDSYMLVNFSRDLKILLLPYMQNNITFNGKNIFLVFGFPDDLFDRLDKLIERKFTGHATERLRR